MRKLFASVLDLVVGSAARRVRPSDAALALGIVWVVRKMDQPNWEPERRLLLNWRREEEKERNIR